MILYYNTIDERFTLRKTDACEPVFETYEKKERIGWSNGVNPPIKKGNVEILIGTNFYPSSSKRECIRVKITVNGVLLLPLSMACRKACKNYHFSKHQIAFLQYGPGNNAGKEPVTIMKRGKGINWESVLYEICEVCNNYQQWIIKETKLLIATLSEHTRANFWNISTLLELVRTYESIVPDIIPIYRQYVDQHCFEAIKNLLEFIEIKQMDKLNKRCKRKDGDVIWTYIKDFYLST